MKKNGNPCCTDVWQGLLMLVDMCVRSWLWMDNQFFSLGRRAENVDAIGERDGIYASREGGV